jgi:transposase
MLWVCAQAIHSRAASHAYSGLQLNIRHTGASLCCMKPYSLDLRQNILDAYDHQLGSQRAVAALFGVSRAVLEPLLRRRRTTGDIAPRPHAGGRQPRCDPMALALVRQFVREQPAATLEELWAQLHPRRGLRLSMATMCRVLQRLGLPRKKSPLMPPHATRRGSSRPVPTTSNARPRSISGA